MPPNLSSIAKTNRAEPGLVAARRTLGLRKLIGHSLISCTINGSDRYGRALATCSTDRVGDVGEAMVRAGLAVNFLGWRYQLAQLQARAQKRGGWRGTFETPQDWRRRRRTADR